MFGRGRVEAMTGVFDMLVPRAVSSGTFPSYVTDDHTPFEFSVALGSEHGHAALRLLAEPQAADQSLSAFGEAARGVAGVLERRFGAHLGRFRALQDLLLPPEPGGPFAVWYAVDFGQTGEPSFKVYLDPQTRGLAHAPRVVEEALERLGIPDAWRFVSDAARRGPELDELRFVSLDLKDSPSARVKVYLFHKDASFGDIDHAAGQAVHHDSTRLRGFLRTITGGEGYLVAERDVGTCLSFVGNERPRASTVHVPIRAFAGNDEIARARIELAATELGLDLSPYRAVVEALRARPLRQGAGFHSYASLRADEGGSRLNLYLSPELRGTVSPRAPRLPSVARPERQETPIDVVERYENHRPITTHPFLQRIARRPVSLPALTLLVYNFREAITRDFARRLAQIVARVEEDSLRSVLAKQLDDELGNGDFKKAHSILFERFVEALSGHLPDGFSESMLAPGKELGSFLERVYTTGDPYEGLGAALIMEVFGRQVDSFLGDQFRRAAALPGALPATALEWLNLHETLEVAHVDESVELARAIPPGPKASASAQGASGLGSAGWAFFDALDRLGVR
jgi:DMATS type aromatic prenyltransferase